MIGSVLVADHDSERAKHLREALVARGFEVRSASDGAEALESALTDIPDAVIVAPDLELIDPPTLAQLLRANPRTQRTRRLYLGEIGPEEAELFDDQLPRDVGAEPLAERLEALVTQRARLEAAWQERESAREVEGQLAQVALTDLLELFHANRRTGRVELRRPGAGGREEFGTIWLQDGQPVQARIGQVEGEKALFRMLTWSEGHFAFTPGLISVTPKIATPLRGLLMEGVRQLDEWENRRQQLPPMEGRVQLRVPPESLPSVVQPLTQEVLHLLELYNRVRDILDHSTFPDYQVLRTLQALIDRELVELRRDAHAVAREPGPAFLSAEDSGRLAEWMRNGLRQHRAKVIVAVSSAMVLHDFLELLAGLSCTHLAEELRGEFPAADQLVPLGVLELDRELAVELWLVPSGPENAPFWPVMTHGALGTLLLARHGEPKDSLAPFREALAEDPQQRSFHVMLLGKEERSVRDEVEEHFPLLEDSSLFLLPQEGADEAGEVLRSLIRRLVP